VIRKLFTLLLITLWSVALDGSALAQCYSQPGIGFDYAGPFNIGSCGMLGLATCVVKNCTNEHVYVPPPDGLSELCSDNAGSPQDSFDCYYFSPSVSCNCMYPQLVQT
jgi:hypothetical protein